MQYQGHLLGEGSYPSAEKQSVYCTAPADRVSERVVHAQNTYSRKHTDAQTQHIYSTNAYTYNCADISKILYGFAHTHAYIYIYVFFFKKKNKTGHIRIINLFPSCYVFLIKSKNTKNIYRTSSDLMDKIIQNRHRKEGWEGIERGCWVFSSLSPLPFFF